jgi:hypothetical protein
VSTRFPGDERFVQVKVKFNLVQIKFVFFIIMIETLLDTILILIEAEYVVYLNFGLEIIRWKRDHVKNFIKIYILLY